MARMVLRRDLGDERSRPSLPSTRYPRRRRRLRDISSFLILLETRRPPSVAWEESPVPPRRSSGVSNWDEMVPAKKERDKDRLVLLLLGRDDLALSGFLNNSAGQSDIDTLDRKSTRLNSSNSQISY